LFVTTRCISSAGRVDLTAQADPLASQHAFRRFVKTRCQCECADFPGYGDREARDATSGGQAVFPARAKRTYILLTEVGAPP
jgi:hypothetical protein